MAVPQDPTRARLFAAAAGIGSLALVAFVTETGLGRELVRQLTSSSIVGVVSHSSTLATLAVWCVLIVTAVFVIDTAIAYFVDQR